jgi:glycerophosphoryl diester phosphodiesterase
MDIKNSWAQILKYLHQSWHQMFVTHLAYTALGIVLFTPLIGLSGRLLLKLSGQTALADQDIAYFLLSPVGMVVLIVLAARLFTIIAVEQAALIRIARGIMSGQEVGTVDALVFTTVRLKKLFLFAARLVARVLLITLPLLALAGLIAFFLITEFDINYYLTERPPEFLIAVILIGIVLLIMLILLIRKLLSWSLALPLVLFADVTPADSFSESRRVVLGNRKIVLFMLLSWGVVAFLLGLLLIGTLKLLGSWIVPTVSDSLSLMVVVLGGLSFLLMLGNFLVTVFTSGSFSYLILGLYKKAGPEFKIELLENNPASRSLAFRLTKSRIAVALVLGIAIAGATGVWLIKDIQISDEVLIIAHRGAAGKAPENTLASFHQAIADKTDWIELDVQETADGEVVVMHDSDFMKLAADRTKLWDATLPQLAEIDIGSWFDPSFSAERVPTLKEVLEVSKGKAQVVIELKYYGHDEKLEQRVAEIVEATDMVNETAIMSLKYDAVKKMRSIRPDWTIGLLSTTAIGDLTSLDTDFLAVSRGMATAGFIRRVHEANKKIYVWTINDPVSMSQMISLGVDGLITDEPEMARQVLAEREGLSTMQRLLIQTATLFGESFTPKQYRDDSP